MSSKIIHGIPPELPKLSGAHIVQLQRSRDTHVLANGVFTLMIACCMISSSQFFYSLLTSMTFCSAQKPIADGHWHLKECNALSYFVAM